MSLFEQVKQNNAQPKSYERALKALELHGGYIYTDGGYKNVSDPAIKREWERRLKIQGIEIPK